METAKCPYCNSLVEICHDDGRGYDEDVPWQEECSECGKTFIFFTTITFSYDTQKADCLNGGEHDFEETTTYPKYASKLRCNTCCAEKPLTEGHPFLLMDRP